MDCLKIDGNEPETRDMLTMSVMIGASMDRQSLSSDVGIGSRSHCLFGDELMSRVISSMAAGWKEVMLTGGDGGSGVCGVVADGGMDDCSREILSEKNDAND